MSSPLEKFRVGDKVTVHDRLIDKGVVSRVGRKYVTVPPENSPPTRAGDAPVRAAGRGVRAAGRGHPPSGRRPVIHRHIDRQSRQALDKGPACVAGEALLQRTEAEALLQLHRSEKPTATAISLRIASRAWGYQKC